MFVEFLANMEGYGDIIQLGDGSLAQSQLSQVPYDIVIDRVYLHGHPLYGQKRGIALNARLVTIRNSHIAEIKAVGADSQAIGGWNGPGPFIIENNYLEAAGEVFLLGGAEVGIRNLVSEDVSVKYNQMSRPMSWRDPIIPAPSGATAALSVRRDTRARYLWVPGGGAPASRDGEHRQFRAVAGDRRRCPRAAP